MSLTYSPKDPLETVILSMDFSLLLGSGETVVSADWLLSRLDVAEDTTSMLVSATNMGSAPVIKQTITGGTSGGSYLHRPRIITSLGQTLIPSAIQVVSTGG